MLLGNAIDLTFKNNSFFTPYMQKRALSSLALKYLDLNSINSWIDKYDNITVKDTVVGVIMAGNLPLVGFHDFISVMATGCKILIRLSSKDRFLMPALTDMLNETDHFWRGRIAYTTELPVNTDMIIATGADRTADYFNEVFRNTPRIIRGSRSSVAVLSGVETESDLEKLADDMFLYFGMGCRSVSMLLIPKGYDFGMLLAASKKFSFIAENKRYMASCVYNRAMAVMNGISYVDGGFFILKEGDELPPPAGVISYITYSSYNEIDNLMYRYSPRLQCVVNYLYDNRFIKFGESQSPSLDCYADNVNSLDFILKKS